MFLHTYCTVPAEPGFEETVVLDGHWWAKTGGGDWQAREKLFFAFFM